MTKKLKKKADFNYTYAAPTIEERKEIENIKNSYIKKETVKPQTKLSRLRSLDMKVKNTPDIIALIFGIVGTLIFGLGLSMVLEFKIALWGILVGAVGAIIMILAYPVHQMIKNSLKRKYAPEIIKLSEELLNEKPNIEFKD